MLGYERTTSSAFTWYAGACRYTQTVQASEEVTIVKHISCAIRSLIQAK
jgi:hypothetical protein